MPQPLPALFGQVVRRRREAARLSQEELGARTGLSRNYVGMIERGETNPTLMVLRDLASALGTTMSSLILELDAATTPTARTRRPKR